MNENSQRHIEATTDDQPDADAALATPVPDPSSFHGDNPFSQSVTQAAADSAPLATTSHQANGEGGVRPLTTWMGSVLCFLLGWFAVAVFTRTPIRREAELPPPSKQSVAVQNPQAAEPLQTPTPASPSRPLPAEPPALTMKKEQVTQKVIQTSPPRAAAPAAVPSAPAAPAATANAQVAKVEDEGTRLRRIFNKTVQAANELKQ